MRKGTLVLMLCSLILCLSACGTNNQENVLPSDITYTTTSLKEMYQVFSQNRARYEAEYLDKYLSITGEVKFIASENYFSITEYSYNYSGQKTGYYGYATAQVKSDELKNTVLSLNIGDTVTIMGKVVGFSYTTSCDVKMDVYEIIIR